MIIFVTFLILRNIEKRILGDITVSVGAFLALLIIRFNCRGVRRSKNDALSKKGQHKVTPDLRGPRQSLMLPKRSIMPQSKKKISSNGAEYSALATSRSSHKRKSDETKTSIDNRISDVVKTRVAGPPSSKIMPSSVGHEF